MTHLSGDGAESMCLTEISRIRTGGGYPEPVWDMNIHSSTRQRIFSRAWRMAVKVARLPLKMLMRPRRCVMRFLNPQRKESGSLYKAIFDIAMRKMQNWFIGSAFLLERSEEHTSELQSRG